VPPRFTSGKASPDQVTAERSSKSAKVHTLVGRKKVVQRAETKLITRKWI